MSKKLTWSDRIWGSHATFSYVFLFGIILLFTMLGAREIWTQEHRWADIVSGMFYRNDFLHPYLDESNYYDKPLLSYWLIAIIAKITGKLSTWALRLPSAFAGLLSLFAIYRLGYKLRDKSLGLLSAWMLLTTFYFVFWARTSSADMLNIAGTLLGVMWYFETKDKPNFINYAVFFLIMAITALCKGLVGPVVTLLAIFPDLVVQGNWKKHFRISFFLAIIPAAIIYVLPFWASAHFGGETYSQNGLYLVYKENILRYFQPFDHKDPIYTYFLYLPIYLLPWTIFFIPALVYLFPNWKKLSWNSKWIAWSLFILFLFFTLSGSRRSYYVLPMVPFALLFTADWIVSGVKTHAKRYLWVGRLIPFFYLILLVNFDVVQPIYYSRNGLENFAKELKLEATQIQPWSQWNIVLLDPESKIRFYLELPPTVKNYGITGPRKAQTHDSLIAAWPVLENKPANTIFITRKIYVPLLWEEFKNYQLFFIEPSAERSFLDKNKDENDAVAFIPR